MHMTSPMLSRLASGLAMNWRRQEGTWATNRTTARLLHLPAGMLTAVVAQPMLLSMTQPLYMPATASSC